MAEVTEGVAQPRTHERKGPDVVMPLVAAEELIPIIVGKGLTTALAMSDQSNIILFAGVVISGAMQALQSDPNEQIICIRGIL